MNQLKQLLLLVVLVFCCTTVYGRQLDTTMLYDLVNLGKKVNSRYHDAAPIVTPDGSRLYFFIADHPENTFGKEHSQDIWYCDKDADGFWQSPVHMAAPLNKHRYNQVLAVTDNGNTLLLRGGAHKKDGGFSISRQAGGNWSKPSALKIAGYQQMNKGRFSGAVLSANGKVLLLYFSERPQSKYSDLYVSFSNGDNSWSRPQKLSINTARDEFGPFLAADMRTMYFASNRPGGVGGTDIWVSQRLDDTWLNWAEPVNLGEPVNTTGFDAYFSVDASGKHAFTTRAYISADGGSLDILGLVPKPVLNLSGTVYDAKTGKPIPEVEIEYHVKDDAPQYRFADETGSYKTVVRTRGKYMFHLVQPGYLDVSDEFDLTNAPERGDFTKDFTMEPVTAEIILYGRVYDSATSQQIVASLTLQAPGVKPITITANDDDEEGYYLVRLPQAGPYTVTATAPDYLPFAGKVTIPEPQDLYAEEEYNLYLQQVPPNIFLEGYVANKKTEQPMGATLRVEGPGFEQTLQSDPGNGYFNLQLPGEGRYFLYSVAPGFLNFTDSVDVFTPENNNDTYIEKDVYLVPIEIGVTVRLNKIYFDFDKATLRPESFPELNRVTKLMEQNPTVAIEIAGHTDNKGTDQYNIKLSQGRADAVKNYIVGNGVAAKRIVAKGYGESQPEVANNTDQNRQINRRVVFTVLSK